MKQRLLRISIILLVPLMIFAVLMAIVTRAEPIMPAVNDDTVQAAPDNTNTPAIIARRMTSIPYTIDSPLPLSVDGQTVVVSGPGECPPEGDTFNISIIVTQNGQQVRAIGNTEGDCAGQTGYSVTATTPGMQTLTPGHAEVCGQAIIFGTPHGSLVGDWCKTVMLE